MADFCKLCSIELFGQDERDLANLNPKVTLGPGEGFAVICEGCGFVYVNHEGECLGCDKHEGPARKEGE